MTRGREGKGELARLRFLLERALYPLSKRHRDGAEAGIRSLHVDLRDEKKKKS